VKKVLIADDDPVSRKLILKMIKSMGHLPIQSSNGKRALDVLLDNPDFDLLIADIMMPEMGGKDLIRILRGNKEYDRLPIIVISGVVKLRDIKDVLELGASFFMPKPIKSDEFKNYVASLIDE